MLGFYDKDREVEKPKPFTEAKKVIARDVIQRMRAALGDYSHQSPCPKAYSDDRNTPLRICTCWHAHALAFLDKELKVYE